ncbi:unnamed protein product [Prunus armeniaca]|uniref:Uncharacterized protein n=1 Tax=Prunus armeniaca TaxID=36596 RepID=A0A6J5WZ75_PRUAR|nr:unnamed protein product [Prunus armeniaca]CAB4305255.1 unnamed protein product [Prunus armeniaca]
MGEEHGVCGAVASSDCTVPLVLEFVLSLPMPVVACSVCDDSDKFFSAAQSRIPCAKAKF